MAAALQIAREQNDKAKIDADREAKDAETQIKLAHLDNDRLTLRMKAIQMRIDAKKLGDSTLLERAALGLEAKRHQDEAALAIRQIDATPASKAEA